MNDLKNIKRNNKAYVLRIKIMKEMIELKKFTFDKEKQLKEFNPNNE